MLPDGSIHAEHIWKRFRADRRGMLLRSELRRLSARLRGKGTRPHWRWALRDISLDVAPGEAVGLVGPNGSGKTTLLKVLSGVMYPYAGRLEVRGRVGALIEIRAGIHPELTGRENVFLFGSLLGLSRKEVAKRFDEIIAFAELESAVDRQAKFYSSGMQMRLGFSVAAFLEPHILLVDEVLAVGDASFQQRCLDRMREVLASGTTVIYVSHDLASVEATVTRCLWLSQGTVRMDGPVREVLEAYRSAIEEAAVLSAPSSGVRVLDVEVTGPGGGPRSHAPCEIRMRIDSAHEPPGGVQYLYLGVSEGPATPIFVVNHDLMMRRGEQEVRCSIRSLPLPQGKFYLWAGIFGRAGGGLLPWHPVRSFSVVGKELPQAPRAIVRPVPVLVETEWDISRSTGASFANDGARSARSGKSLRRSSRTRVP